jgi:hypothetical protein
MHMLLPWLQGYDFGRLLTYLLPLFARCRPPLLLQGPAPSFFLWKEEPHLRAPALCLPPSMD